MNLALIPSSFVQPTISACYGTTPICGRSSYLNLIWIISHRHTLRFVSLMTLNLIKLTVKITDHSLASS